ncbi:MAG: hypothetical protein J6C80_03640 [Flavobacteriales bacterium]|nr:hypothetical protein [Flavobacteriales bacterium]
MENIPSSFINGLYDRAALDVVTLFLVVLMVAYPLSRYIKVGSMCMTFALCMVIGQVLGINKLLPSSRVIEVMMILSILLPAVMGMFVAGGTPSRAVERIGAMVSGLAGLSYGMVNYAVVKGVGVLGVALYGLGELCGCIVVAFIVILAARVLELLSMTRRDIVIITSSICVGLYARHIWEFLCRIF